MHLAPSCLLILFAVAAASAEPQFIFGYQPFYQPHFGYQKPSQMGFLRSSLEETNQKPENRLAFGTTITVATVTSTSTITTSTTCTTSTAPIKTCSPSGRRRRGLNAKSRGLFYTEDEDNFDSIFVRPPEREIPAVEPKSQERETVSPMVPFIIQPGFSLPDGRQARFMVAFATRTLTTFTTSTYTAFLTALCRSVTTFGTCSGSGK